MKYFLITLTALIFLVVPQISFADIQLSYEFPCSATFWGTCPDQTTIPGYIVRLYQFGLGFVGILAVGMIVAGAILYAISAGKPDKQGEAKDMITSALWGMLLLLGAYLILNTINPRLVSLKDPSAVKFLKVGSTQNTDEELKQLGQELLNSGITLGTYASCLPGSDPQNVVRDVSNGIYPFVCSNGCTDPDDEDILQVCTPGGPTGHVSLSKNLIRGLLELQRQKDIGWIADFRITSLTGGDHKEGSKHYDGRAVDIVVNTNDASEWDKVRTELLQNGGFTFAKCEYRDDGETKFTTNCADMFPDGTNKHIHAHL